MRFISVFLALTFVSVVAAQDLKILEPSKLNLGTVTRTQNFVSALGPVELRWPRSVEPCFERAPNRSVGAALVIASKLIRKFPFPKTVRDSGQSWSLVFTDLKSAVKQFPAALLAGQHPGFMLPPNKIYLVAEFIAGDCESKAGDAQLEQVLLHEIGHIVEYLILGESFLTERARAEGFATWFEIEALKVSGNELAVARHSELARTALKEPESLSSSKFNGSAKQYAAWGALIGFIVERYGFEDLIKLYKGISDRKGDFLGVTEKELSVDREKLLEQLLKSVIK